MRLRFSFAVLAATLIAGGLSWAYVVDVNGVFEVRKTSKTKIGPEPESKKHFVRCRWASARPSCVFRTRKGQRSHIGKQTVMSHP
jgi:hypothetical protein